MTYIQTKQGWLYLTVIIDLFTRKVVGWAMSSDLKTENTITPAWNMAVKNNPITEHLIFHSDRGSQYASYEFTNILKGYKGLVHQSMSRKGNCWDNAVAESFFKSLKVEWIYKHTYNNKSQAQVSVFKWIETCSLVLLSFCPVFCCKSNKMLRHIVELYLRYVDIYLRIPNIALLKFC